ASANLSLLYVMRHKLAYLSNSKYATSSYRLYLCIPHNLGYYTNKAARVISPQRRKSTHGSTKLTTNGFFITAHPQLSRRTRPPRLGGVASCLIISLCPLTS